MFKDDDHPILQYILHFVEITGFSITWFIDHFIVNGLLTWVIGISITIFLTVIVSILIAKKYRSQLAKKDEELAEKNEKLAKKDEELAKKNEELVKKDEELAKKDEELAEKDEKLAGKDAELTKKDEKIKELKDTIGVWEKAFITEKPVQAGYYLTNKEIYDDFRTELDILNCELDVSLEEDSKNKEIRHLKFIWTLTVLNFSDKPVEAVHFIYSGDKDDRSRLTVTVDGEPAKVIKSLKYREEIKGDDCFIEIILSKSIGFKETRSICIEYMLPKYEFNKKYDLIWLVPNALGFKDMSKFRIRFFGDGEVVKDTTTCKLKSYRLSGDFPSDKIEEVDFKQLDDTGEGFECIRQRGGGELMERGYLLILINDWSDLPLYFRDVAT